MTYLINYNDFERMQDMNDNMPKEMSYSEFLNWNTECLNKQSKEDLDWIHGLCTRSRKINLVDLEDCQEWETHGIYFNMKGELCIYHPR